MIKVTVELWPGGRYKLEDLAGLTLGNITPGARRDDRRGDYSVRVTGRHGRRLPQRDAEVHDHARLDEPVLTLVRKALEAAGY